MDDEELYRPILKPGQHILKSKANPERVRGLSRDANNNNPDIIEWEKVKYTKQPEREPLGPKETPANKKQSSNTNQHKSNPSEKRQDSSTIRKNTTSPTKQMVSSVKKEVADTLVEELSAAIAEALVNAVISGSKFVIYRVISPWWQNHAKPWIKEEAKSIPARIKASRQKKTITDELLEIAAQTEAQTKAHKHHTTDLDEAFQQIRFEMDAEEAKKHAAKALFHLLSLANEIRIISNSRIREETESEQEQIEQQRAAEKILTAEVAGLLDNWLSSDTVELDAEAAKAIFGVVGGGVRLNGEYIPVDRAKLESAIQNAPPIEESMIDKKDNPPIADS